MVKRTIAYAMVFCMVVGVAHTGSVKSTNGSRSLVIDQIGQVDAVPSIDQIMEADIVANLAEAINLPIAANSANMSTSLAIKHEIAQLNDTSLQKPQIIDISNLSRGIKAYKVVKGDTLAKIAALNNVSTQTLRWANKLKKDSDIKVGMDLVVPSVDGVVYKAKKGDTIKSLAKKYQSTVDKITIFNDLELEGIQVGQKIIIPGGVLPETERPEYVPPKITPLTPSTPVVGGGWSGNVSAGNKYAYGYCTWYVYNRRQAIGKPIGSYWGDAIMWYSSATMAGYSVGHEPRAGAIMYGPGNHVAMIDSVNGNTVVISEMNYNGVTNLGEQGGWNRISHRTMSLSAARGYWYIY